MQFVNRKIYTKSIIKKLSILELTLISIEDTKVVPEEIDASAWRRYLNENFMMSTGTSSIFVNYKLVHFKDKLENAKTCMAKIEKIAFIIISVNFYF